MFDHPLESADQYGEVYFPGISDVFCSQSRGGVWHEKVIKHSLEERCGNTARLFFDTALCGGYF